MFKDRDLLPKKYVDLNFTPFTSKFLTNPTYLTGTPITGQIKHASMPARSYRSLKNSKNLDLPDHETYRPNLKHNHSSKSSFFSSFNQKSHLNTRTENFLKPCKTISQPIDSPTTKGLLFTPRGFQGYKFSILNTRRNIIKSKFLRKPS